MSPSNTRRGRPAASEAPSQTISRRQAAEIADLGTASDDLRAQVRLLDE
jgi:hypothetical protein